MTKEDYIKVEKIYKEGAHSQEDAEFMIDKGAVMGNIWVQNIGLNYFESLRTKEPK